MSWLQTERHLSLSQYLEHLFHLSQQHLSSSVPNSSVKGLLVPHAGIQYSGLAAASAYQSLLHTNYTRIILLCTNHQNNQPKLWVPSFKSISSFLTTQSTIKIDHKIINHLVKQGLVEYYSKDQIFQQEHSFFIQLPFITKVLPKAKLIPIIVGNINTSHTTAFISTIQQYIDDQTVLICSSDISHLNDHFPDKISHPNFSGIVENDNKTLEYLFQTKPLNPIQTQNLLASSACVKYVIQLFKSLLFSLGLRLYPRLQCYYNSLQKIQQIDLFDFNLSQLTQPMIISSQEQSSVSYVGIIYSQVPYILDKRYNRQLQYILTDFEKACLLQYSRQQLINYFQPHKYVLPYFNASSLQLGLFVTLKIDDSLKKNNNNHNNNNHFKLRGCIGMIYPNQLTIQQAIEKYSLESALRDPRFPPVHKKEVSRIQIEISLLNQAQKISLEEYLGSRFVLDRDGIYIQSSGKSGFFLPSVAQEFGYNKIQLLETLCQHKVGLSSSCYKNSDIQIEYMEGTHFKE